jgi:hypothetical protein
MLVNRRQTGLDASQPFSWEIQAQPLLGMACTTHMLDVQTRLAARVESLLTCPRPERTDAPLSQGQIVCCQIDPRTSLESYGARAGNPEFRRNANLTRERWRTAIRPAVVLEAEQEEYPGLWRIQVACVGQGDPNLLGDEVTFVPISSRGHGNFVPSPAWPVPNTYCYVSNQLLLLPWRGSPFISSFLVRHR